MTFFGCNFAKKKGGLKARSTPTQGEALGVAT